MSDTRTSAEIQASIMELRRKAKEGAAQVGAGADSGVDAEILPQKEAERSTKIGGVTDAPQTANTSTFRASTQEPIKEKSIFTGRLKTHCELIHHHTEASLEQVELMALALYGFALSYAGVEGVSLYAFDLSDTATGKSHNERIQRDAICKPIVEIQEQKHAEAVEIWQGLKKDERPPQPPKFLNIHASKTTAANLFKSFESEPTQLIFVDEMGMWLDNLSGQDLLEYITKLYGVKEAALPSLKSEISAKASTAARLSFIGLTTTQYFRKFGAHLEGGFGNRPLLAFNDRLCEPKTLPTCYELDRMQKSWIEGYTKELLEFYAGGFNPYIKSDLFRKFKEDLQTKKIELKEAGDMSYFYYARAAQNVEMVAKVLHCLNCLQTGIKEPVVSEAALKEAITYYQERIIKSVERLLFHLTGEAKEERLDGLAVRVDEKIKELGLPCKMRDIYRNIKGLRAASLIECITGRYSFVGTEIRKKL